MQKYFAGPSTTVRFFAPTQIIHFQDLLPLSFLFICTLHWCNCCTGLEVSPNFRKFPLTAVCGIDVKRVLSSPVLDGTLFAPTQGLRCQALLALSFLFICTLQWCKRCRCSPEFPQSSIDGAMRNSCWTSSFQARPRRFAVCIDPDFTFSGCPSP